MLDRLPRCAFTDHRERSPERRMRIERAGGIVHEVQHGATQRLGAAEGRIGKVEAAAKENGISLRTLRRAREGLRVVVEKSSYEGGWVWRLPR